MRMAMILLCLVLATTYLVTGMLARYATSDKDADSARVAAFVFNVADGEGSHIIDLKGIQKPGDSLTYRFSVRNNSGSLASEVAETYDLTLLLNGSMPLTCTVKKDDTRVLSLTMPDSPPADGVTATKSAAGTFSASTPASDNYTLTVEWPAALNNIEFASAASAAEVKLIVTGMQID